LRRVISRLIAVIEQRGDMDMPGVLWRNHRRWIDSGNYGDPHENNDPDFVKRDDEGWKKL